MKCIYNIGETQLSGGANELVGGDGGGDGGG